MVVWLIQVARFGQWLAKAVRSAIISCAIPTARLVVTGLAPSVITTDLNCTRRA